MWQLGPIFSQKTLCTSDAFLSFLANLWKFAQRRKHCLAYIYIYHFLIICKKHKISCDSSWMLLWIKLHLNICLCILYFHAFYCFLEWSIVFEPILIKIVIVFMLFGNTIHFMVVPFHDVLIMNPLTNLEFTLHIWSCLFN